MVSKGLSFKIFLCMYSGMNLASASSREKPKVVWVRSLVPKQKKLSLIHIYTCDVGDKRVDGIVQVKGYDRSPPNKSEREAK